MLISNERLLAGLQESVNGLAALNDSPSAKTLQTAATTILCELRRREDRLRHAGNYARGLALGRALAAAMSNSSQGAAMLKALPEAMDAGIGSHAAIDLFRGLRDALTQLVKDSGYPQTSGAGTAIDAAVRDLFAWEAELRALPPPLQAAPRADVDMRAVLEKSTRARGGVLANARVTSCTPLQGGFGKNTILFEVEDGEGKPWRLVARAMQPINLLGLPGQDIGREYHLLCYAHRHGICVAEPLWIENDPAVHGVRFLVSRQVMGRNYGTAVGSEPLSSAQVKSLARELAAIHSLALDPADADVRQSAVNAADTTRPLTEIITRYLDTWETLWHSLGVGAYPVVQAVLQWLRVNLPQADDVPVFLHGDYALHNILIDGDEVSGVLDWELPHVGDRAEDISWLLSSIGKHVSQEDFMREYLAAGGRRVSDFQLRYYEVVVHMKMLMVTLESQLRFQLLPHAGPHYCILGLGFIQHPSNSLAGAIAAAEAAR